jgi:hypothetical protein
MNARSLSPGRIRPEADMWMHPEMTLKLFGPPEAAAFQRQGFLRLKGVHSKARLATLKEKILQELSRLKLTDGGRNGASALQALPPFQQIARLSSAVKVDAHDVLCTQELRAAIFALTGKTALSEQGSQLLLSLGHQGRWSLNGLNWHVDLASKPEDKILGVQAFYLLDDVMPHGGATLALARSHYLPLESSRRLRASLKQSDDIQSAALSFDTEIVEMSGRAGDVYLMDMRVLHTPSINATKHIRMMATTRFQLGS